LFPEVFQNYIPTQTETNKGKVFIAAVLKDMGHDGMEVLRVPAVVKADLLIGLATAPAEVPNDRIPPPAVERTDYAENVRAGGVAFQPVGEDDNPAGSDRRVIEVQKVIIRSSYAPPNISDTNHMSEEVWIDGLEMAIREKQRRAV
jgi:hypothetical protein